MEARGSHAGCEAEVAEVQRHCFKVLFQRSIPCIKQAEEAEMNPLEKGGENIKFWDAEK